MIAVPFLASASIHSSKSAEILRVFPRVLVQPCNFLLLCVRLWKCYTITHFSYFYRFQTQKMAVMCLNWSVGWIQANNFRIKFSLMYLLLCGQNASNKFLWDSMDKEKRGKIDRQVNFKDTGWNLELCVHRRSLFVQWSIFFSHVCMRSEGVFPKIFMDKQNKERASCQCNISDILAKRATFSFRSSCPFRFVKMQERNWVMQWFISSWNNPR